MTYERHPQAIYTSRLMPFIETKDILQDSKQTSTPNNTKQVDMNQENSKRLHNIENINIELEEQVKELRNITKQQILSEEIYNEPDVISETSEEESQVVNEDKKKDRELLETVMTHNIELEYKKRELEETVERLKNLTRTVSYDTKRWDDTIIKILRQPNERREREDVIMIKARLREEFPNHDIDQTHEEMELIMRHRLGIINRRNFEAMILYAKREHKSKITRVRNENKILKDRIAELTNEDIEGRLKNQQEYNEDSGARRIYNLCTQLKELGEENEKLKERIERYKQDVQITSQQEDNTEETLEMTQDELDELDIMQLQIPLPTTQQDNNNIGEMASTIIRQRKTLDEISKIQDETVKGLKKITRLTEMTTKTGNITTPIVKESNLQEANKRNEHSEASSIHTDELGEGSGLTVEEKIDIQKRDMIETIEMIRYIQPINLNREKSEQQTSQVPEPIGTDEGLAITLGQTMYCDRARTEPPKITMKMENTQNVLTKVPKQDDTIETDETSLITRKYRTLKQLVT